ncbi:acyl-CoA dehydrogenase family protein [Dactylosporangium sp. NPDC051484]
MTATCVSTRFARIFQAARVQKIHDGTNEIMKDLISRAI